MLYVLIVVDDERVIIVLDNLSEMLVKSSSLCRTLIGMVDYLQRKDIKVLFLILLVSF